MQRREGGGRLELSQHSSVDQAMLPQLRSAMHDAMPDGVRRWHIWSRPEVLRHWQTASRWPGIEHGLESKELFCESLA